MADRNERNRNERSYRDNDYNESRQAEQFDESSSGQEVDFDRRDRDQMGETSGRGGGDFYYEEVVIVPRRRRGGNRDEQRGYGGRGQERGYSRDNERRGRGDYDDYDDRERAYGASHYDNRYDRGFQPFTSEDQGGGDFVRGGRRPYGGYGGGYGGGYSDYGESSREYRASREPQYGYRNDYRDRHERGFFDKAGDEIASWFGDEEAARRREMDHRGRGPGNYTRSDERILEDACDNLTDDWRVDARNIQVTVKDGEVTLDGTVEDRGAKRRAEDCVDEISGVKHVQNNLRVQEMTGEETGSSSARRES